MHVYEFAAPIDYFCGMTPVSLMFDNAVDDMEFDDNSFFMTKTRLCEFLRECFLEVLMHDTAWEGDIRGDNIAMGGFPVPDDCAVANYLVFKQNNNGTSFMVSPMLIDLPGYEDALCRRRSLAANQCIVIQGIVERIMDNFLCR